MRISDWSSDVCSSDLPPRAARHSCFTDSLDAVGRGEANDQVALVGEHRAAQLVDALQRDIDNEGLDRRHQSGRQGGGATLLIGRASSREGVCRSVWISVVAVALKKTNQQTMRQHEYIAENKRMSEKEQRP